METLTAPGATQAKIWFNGTLCARTFGTFNILKSLKRKKTTPPQATRHADYRRLPAALTLVGWISEGYVQDRGPGVSGPCYQWTRKVRGKTVSVALSREPYEWLREAIAN